MNKLLFFLVLISFVKCQDSLDLNVIREIQKSKIPAVVMGKVTKQGDMQFFSKGPSRWERNDTINENNIFRIASMTKARTSLGIIILWERALLKSLDDPIDNYIPEFKKLEVLESFNTKDSTYTSKPTNKKITRDIFGKFGIKLS